MQKIIITLLFSLSPLSLAALREGNFKGNGVWKMSDGTLGMWTETLKVQITKDGLQTSTHLVVFKDKKIIHEEKATAQYVHTGNHFFDIKMEDKVVGNAYCFRDICHVEYQNDKEKGEETLHISNRVIHKMGSSRGEHSGQKWTVAWRGALHRN